MLPYDRCEGRDIRGIVATRDERDAVGDVQRRRQWIDVGGDRDCAGPPKRSDDVDP